MAKTIGQIAKYMESGVCTWEFFKTSKRKKEYFIHSGVETDCNSTRAYDNISTARRDTKWYRFCPFCGKPFGGVEKAEK